MTEFKITGPGEYRQRDGDKLVITHRDYGSGWPWKGFWYSANGRSFNESWREDGTSSVDIGKILAWDAVGPWVEPVISKEPVPAEQNKPVKTLRDEYAMAALTGICGTLNPLSPGIKYEAIADDAYKLADAMLTERSK